MLFATERRSHESLKERMMFVQSIFHFIFIIWLKSGSKKTVAALNVKQLMKVKLTQEVDTQEVM